MRTVTPIMSTDCEPGTSRAMSQGVAEEVAGVMKALADPLRLRILSAIATDERKETCVCDLAALSDVSQPTVSHHLRVLKDTGLVRSERRGTWVWYQIDPSSAGAVKALLDNLAPAAVSGSSEQADRSHDERVAMDGRVTRLAEELADDHPALSRELVMSITRESYAALARTATINSMIIPLTEKFARQRLIDIMRERGTSVPQVLFVCVQNAGRSQLAAALLNERAQGAVIARSAGSAPAADVHPHVQPLLTQIAGSHNADSYFPKPLTDDAVRAADVVVTMGCGDVCPIIPGIRYEDWAVADPALASAEGVEAIRDDIAARVDALLARLTSTE